MTIIPLKPLFMGDFHLPCLITSLGHFKKNNRWPSRVVSTSPKQVGVFTRTLGSLCSLLWMEEILHHLMDAFSHYFSGLNHPRWCRISSIHSIIIFSWKDRFHPLPWRNSASPPKFPSLLLHVFAMSQAAGGGNDVNTPLHSINWFF